MTFKTLTRAARLLPAAIFLVLGGCARFALFNPKGDIASQESMLILVALGLMLLVVIPVIVLTLVFAWRYRASNTKATYAPNWSHSTSIEIVVWTIPCLIVAILAVLIGLTTHTLDPYRPLKSDVAPVRVEVISLDWKWLFIYPDYGVATVNRLEIPADTPINFELTSGSVMNALFIPQLGTQISTMVGMRTQLHLIADHPGTYAGLSSDFSGVGFSDMHFDAVATSRKDFDDWVRRAQASPLHLDSATYRSLEQPSTKNAVTVYSNVATGLFDDVIKKYMPTPMSSMAANSNSMASTAKGPAQRSMN